MQKCDNVRSRTMPTSRSVKFEEFEMDESEGDRAFLEVVDSVLVIAKQTRPGIPNATRTVARYPHALKYVHQRAALHILEFFKHNIFFRVCFQRRRELELEVFADANSARENILEGRVLYEPSTK